MNNRFVKYLFVLLISLPVFGWAQTDFEAFKNKRRADFKAFVEERDKDFADFVKKRWEEMAIMEAQKRILTPKPEVIPKFVEIPGAVPKPVELVKAPKIVPLVLPKEPVLPEVPKIKEPSNLKKPVEKFVSSDFSYFGDEVHWSVLPLPKIKWGSSEAEVSEAWMTLSSWNEVAEPLNLLDKEIHERNLNDWGVYQMIVKMSEKLTSNEDGQRVVTVFLANKMGYKAKLARSQNHLISLVSVEEKVYDHTYLKIEGEKYYIFEPKNRYSNEIYSYPGNYSEKSRPLSLLMVKPLVMGGYLKNRDIDFNYKGRHYSFSFPYNPKFTSFLDEIPPVDIEYYFAQTVPEETAKEMDKALKPILAEMTQEEAVGFLLHMTQVGFKYETDQEQFGREKYFYPVEILAYPYADCEDRSVFYSWMIRRYLGLEIVGLDYPGHISTAVNIDLDGDYFLIDGKKFVACDPTYINAGPGMTQPPYKNESANIIWIK